MPVINGVIYPDTPSKPAKMKTNLGAELGLAGSVPTPQPTSAASVATAAPRTPAIPSASVPVLPQSQPSVKVDYSGFKQPTAEDAYKAISQHPYLGNELGLPGAVAPPMPQTATDTRQQPMAAPQSSVPTPMKDYNAIAKARVAAALEQKRTIANQQKSALDTSYDRTRQTMQEDRVLEDNRNGRLLNPYNGRTSYQQGITNLQRGRNDQQMAQDLQTQKANIDQLLADYENATADEQVRIADELQRADQQYQLSLAQLSGNLPDGSGRTLAGQQFDWQTSPNNPNYQGQVLNNQGQAITNQINQIKLSNLPNEIKQQADAYAQDYAKGTIDLQTAQFNLQQLQDPSSPVNVAKSLDNQLKQMQVDYLPQEQKLQLQQLQKQIAEIGKAPYRTPEEVQMDQVKLATAQEQLKQLQNAPIKSTIGGKESADNYDLIYEDLVSPQLTELSKKQGVSPKELARQLVEQNRDNLTDSDYRKLKDYINTTFQG